MAVIYSHTFTGPPYNLPPAGSHDVMDVTGVSDIASITKVSIGFASSRSLPYGPLTVVCDIVNLNGQGPNLGPSDPVSKTFTIMTEPEIVEFDFPNVIVNLGFGFTFFLGNPIGNPQLTYPDLSIAADYVDGHYLIYLIVEGERLLKPTTPTPANDATEVSWETTESFGKHLSWENGGGATKYDVYFGTVGNLKLIEQDVDAMVVTYATVDYTTTVDNEGVTHAFIREHDENFDTEIPWNVPFYWRVNAKNDDGTTTGDVWTFDARPAKAITPTPEHEEVVADFDAKQLLWVDGGNDTSYDVYFGTLISGPIFIGNAVGPSKTILYSIELTVPITPKMIMTIKEDTHAYIGKDVFSEGTEIDWDVPFYWRIDAKNEFGLTTGDVWNFDARPAKTVNLTPENYDTKVPVRTSFHWDDGSYDAGLKPHPFVTGYYDVYANFDYKGGTPHLFDVLNGHNTYEVTFSITWPKENKGALPPRLLYSLEPQMLYLWRVDARNEYGITAGDTLIFLTGPSDDFPGVRPYDYNPDYSWAWDVDHYDWIDATLVAVGGGRYKQQLVAVGHGVIYFEE